MPRFALVTSGLGNTHGGIGVVAAMIARALSRHGATSIWRHRYERRASIRLGLLFARSLAGSVPPPDFVFYDHVDLARLHALNPLLTRVPYGIFLHGAEVWRPMDPRRRHAIEHAAVLCAGSSTTVARMRRDNPWLPAATVTWLGVRPRAASISASTNGAASTASTSHATTSPPPSSVATARAPMALIVGRMDRTERRKGHDPILDGWPAVSAAVPEARLVVLGGGDDRARLEERVRREALRNVEFRGAVSDTERDELYAACGVFLFPSTQEGFGLAAIEAALAGAPVLGVRGEVIEEILADGSILIDAPTGEAIAEAAIRVLRDPALARALGERGRARARATYLEENFVDRFERAVLPHLEARAADVSGRPTP